MVKGLFVLFLQRIERKSSTAKKIMKNRDSKTILTVFVLISSSIVMLAVALGFKQSDEKMIQEIRKDTVYSVRPFVIPDLVTFAGERMPLENFDTRESLEREILTSAYRHSSTILIIKKSQPVSILLLRRFLQKMASLMISNTLLPLKVSTIT